MIFIHALWCGHRKAMMPAAIEAATQAHATESAMFIALNETLLSPEVRDLLQIRGFPTIMKFNSDGTIIGPHTGGRSVGELLEGLMGSP